MNVCDALALLIHGRGDCLCVFVRRRRIENRACEKARLPTPTSADGCRPCLFILRDVGVKTRYLTLLESRITA